MKNPDFLSLFFVDADGYKNYGLASVKGKYRALPENKEKDAYLIIFMCPEGESIFSFYYVDLAGKYIGHSSLYSGENSIDYVLLEAWSRFNILPIYWSLKEETKDCSLVARFPNAEYIEAYERLREIVSRFRWTETFKVATYGKDGLLDREGLQRYESDRLFYPDLPQQILPPLTL